MRLSTCLANTRECDRLVECGDEADCLFLYKDVRFRCVILPSTVLLHRHLALQGYVSALGSMAAECEALRLLSGPKMPSGC
jgi:hypothetical protein